ncbi:MAG: spore cortex biosynthesis protein YabQ [Ruminiclostridium sp.]|nr:spore cortex biosynthesis protein YabQ [Ruminiclostridium sp.]
MFETLEDALGLVGLYAAVGFCLAVIYNFLRFFRLAFPKMKKAAAVSDFLFAILAGAVLFAFSAEYGMGFFRLYYVVSAAFGFAINMVTLGAAVPVLSRFFGRFCARVAEKAAVPLKFVCDKSTYLLSFVVKIISDIAKNTEKHLKNRRKLLYNVKDNKIEKVYPKGGENRNAIQAKVRKII